MTNLNPIAPMLDAQAWADAHGTSKRSVLRWLQAGELPDAVKIEGTWQIPADAQRVTALDIKPAHEVVALNQAKRSGQGQAVALPEPAPAAPGSDFPFQLFSLDDAARHLRTTTAVVKRLGRLGKLDVGPYGEHGALAVWIER
ncbi:MAG: hypothetical protein FWF90_16150 [Promicromonosporaceae bacterium]|nr:hypothetical protein [Promicromonosporaceae bacterium]